MSASPLPPGPREPPAVQTMWWLARPISFMESCRRRYGDAFSVHFLGFERPMVMLSDPEAVRALYTEQRHGLPPGRTLALLPVMGPGSLLLLEGADHLARRRMMLPPFHGERMRSYETVMRDVAEQAVARWPQDETFALHPHMQALTLEVILRAVFGVGADAGRHSPAAVTGSHAPPAPADSEVRAERVPPGIGPVSAGGWAGSQSSERAARLRERLPRLLGESVSTRLQFRVLLSARLRRGDPLDEVRLLIHEIDELLLAEIAERRGDPELAQREDILSLLMSARMEDGGALTDRELRDQLVTLLLAGHETTATALAWTFDLLLRHPTTLARLTAEIDEETSEDYLRAVIAESLRLRPVVPLAGRRLASALETGGLQLPAGTDVTPAIWLTHTRADLYPEPFAFRPERFLERPPTTYGWIPFGGGIRRCLGAAFAEFEMRVVLQTALRHRRLEPASSRPERVARRNVTFSPRHGTRVRSQLRAGRRPAPVRTSVTA